MKAGAGVQGVEELSSLKWKGSSLWRMDLLSPRRAVQHKARAVILCLGKSPGIWRRLGKIKIQGRGISYCSDVRRSAMQERIVAVVGEGDMVLDCISSDRPGIPKQAYCLDAGKNKRTPPIADQVSQGEKEHNLCSCSK
jgi:alkyl hydroperoxide reductase subunit AhpF